MKELTIGEVARRARLQTSAIRYYERVGLLPPSKRVNGRRRYESSVFQRLGVIQLARRAGFRIGELQLLFAPSGDNRPGSTRWRALAAHKVAEMEAIIKRAQAAKTWLVEAMECECAQTGECAMVTFDDAGNVCLSYPD